MRWWRRRGGDEHRHAEPGERPYTDALLAALFERSARPRNIDPARTGVAIACSQMVGRCLSAAVLTPAGDVADAVRRILYEAGRRLVLDGDSVWRIRYDGRLWFSQAASYDVRGEPDPMTWVYQVVEHGPTMTRSAIVPGEDVLHFRRNVDPIRPWRGTSPLASEAARALAGVEGHEADEAAEPHGFLLPAPARDSDESFTALANAVADSRGSTTVVDHQRQGPAAGGQDYRVQRFGWQPPEGSSRMYSELGMAVAASLGYPIELIGGQGSAAREGLRRFLHTTLSPIADVIEEELETKTGVAVRLDLSAIHAADVMGRARAYGSLVNANMPADEAARVTGLRT